MLLAFKRVLFWTPAPFNHNHLYVLNANFHLLSLLVLAFELINILARRKYAEAPHAFHIERRLCITFILALF